MHTRTRVTVTALATVALLLSAVGIGAATPTDDPIEAAAGWLTTQLTDGERITVQFGDDVFDSPGPTADVLLALAAAGVAAGTIDDITDWFDQPSTVAAYTGDGVDEVYAGATGKLLVVTAATGRDPADVGDRDLVSQLTGLRQADGRFSDTSAFGDFSSTLTQAYAVIGLHRTAPGEVEDEDVQFLLDQQCPEGGFRFDPDAADCVGNVDTTGLVVQALHAVGGTDALDAADDAVDWLVDVQEAGGGFAGGAEPANANSTALGAQALALGGADDEAAAARAFILTLQRDCDGDEPGAIQSRPDDPGDLVLATSQSVWGLTGVSLADVTIDGASSDVPVLDCPEDVDQPAEEEPVEEEPIEVVDDSDDDAEADVGAEEADAEDDADTLPATGGDRAALTVLGLLLMAAGARLVRTGRRVDLA